MENFSVNNMLEMQQALQEKYKNKWEEISADELKEAYTAKFEKNMKRW